MTVIKGVVSLQHQINLIEISLHCLHLKATGATLQSHRPNATRQSVDCSGRHVYH